MCGIADEIIFALCTVRSKQELDDVMSSVNHAYSILYEHLSVIEESNVNIKKLRL